MDFMEAVEQMKQGKKVRRPLWERPKWIKQVGAEIYEDNLGMDVDWFAYHLFIATDWEIVDDDKDWNLINTKVPGGDLIWIKDIKKCRDLILKDLHTINFDDNETILRNDFNEIINERFGDLK